MESKIMSLNNTSYFRSANKVCLVSLGAVVLRANKSKHYKKAGRTIS